MNELKVTGKGRTTIAIDKANYALAARKVGGYQVTRITPYDETEYHWAASNPAGTRWSLYLKGRPVGAFDTKYPEEVARLCKDKDDKRNLKRTGGIN